MVNTSGRTRLDKSLTFPSGFTVSLYEYEATIPTLWDAVKGTILPCRHYFPLAHVIAEFIQENPDLIEKENAMGFVSDNGGNTYNRCHCTSFRSVVEALAD